MQTIKSYYASSIEKINTKKEVNSCKETSSKESHLEDLIISVCNKFV